MKDKEIIEYLKRLGKNGIQISVANNDLDVKAAKGIITPAIIQELKHYKTEIVNYLTGIRIEKNNITPIKNLTGNYPISNAQRRLWVLSQFEGGSVSYNTPSSATLEKNIDIESFKRAIDSVIERHEILRTIFKEDEKGELRQWILKSEDLDFVIDFQDFRKEDNKEGRVKEYIAEDSYKAFDLENGPLLRASLLQTEDDCYVFYYNMHHIISDGWSMEVLSKDVFSYYEAYKENKLVDLKPLRIQYKDYSVWQLAQFEENSFKVHKDYWVNNLKGELALLNLPSSKQRPRVMTNNGHGLTTYINSATTDLLRSYSQENGGSLFIGLLAAWNVLMYRYTSQTDIIIGTPIAGREHADLEDQIGFYLNTLALRNEINPAENFEELFARIKQNTFEAFSHQMYPFDRLLEELDLARDTSRSAVFDVMLILQNNGEKTEGIEISDEELDHIIDRGANKSTFDIRIGAKEINDCIYLQVDYNSDIYEKEMMVNLIKHYKKILHALLESPKEKISHIDYLSESEKHDLLFILNDTSASYPKDKTIVDLFEEQVAKTPKNVALVFEGKELTYYELNELSNQLAHCLQKNYNIKPNDLIGINLSRSEWMIISLLGVLKSGGAYVPIDPEYPAARKQYITEDSSLKLLITEANFIHDIDYYEGEIFAIDVEFDPKNYSSEKIDSIPAILSSDLAYVIYTSGSTGNPKGVMIEHKSLHNYLVWALSMYCNDSKNMDFGLFTSLSFDLTVTSVYLPLVSGGKLSVFNSTSDTHSLLKSYFESKIRCIKLTPAHVSLLKSIDIKSTMTQVVIVGGETLEQTHVEILKKLNTNIQVFNEYGPTESTVGCTAVEVISKEDITIGKPIANTQIYFLEEGGELCPKGVIGEICIGGDGLARGYLNKEELTKEKFINNPFKEGERLYKTGDIGRWLADGNIEFIGRKDDQVKIRGYRIELGEIENVLKRNKAIEQAVVVVKANEDKEKELVAYIVAKTEQNTTEIKSYLKDLLPDHMLPTYYVQLESLPLTTNGKIDKRSLPDPKEISLSSGVEYVAPRNETEEKLVKIWQEVLKRDKIGVKDDFFALGGHSLKIIKVINQINKQFGLKYDLKGVYTESTIELFAKEVERITWLSSDKEKSNSDNIIEI